MKKNIKPKPYFAGKEEQAVLDYINTDSGEEKNRIYSKSKSNS